MSGIIEWFKNSSFFKDAALAGTPIGQANTAKKGFKWLLYGGGAITGLLLLWWWKSSSGPTEEEIRLGLKNKIVDEKLKIRKAELEHTLETVNNINAGAADAVEYIELKERRYSNGTVGVVQNDIQEHAHQYVNAPKQRMRVRSRNVVDLDLGPG